MVVTRHARMGMDPWTFSLGQKHVNFKNIAESDTWTGIHAGDFRRVRVTKN